METKSDLNEDENFNRLDIDSVQKATQAISGEIVKDKLLTKLIEIIIKNAGAQKGYIVLKSGYEFSIVAGFNVENKTDNIYNEKLESSNLVSEKIIRYVIRTGENIILHDACNE